MEGVFNLIGTIVGVLFSVGCILFIQNDKTKGTVLILISVLIVLWVAALAKG